MPRATVADVWQNGLTPQQNCQAMSAPIVTALVLSHSSPFEVAIAAEVFGTPRREVALLRGTDEWYDFRLAGERPGQQMPGVGGATTVLSHGLEALQGADLVVVPACANPRQVPWGGDAIADMPATDDHVLAALRDAHASGATLMSYCSGSFVLAESGLLDGRRASTHWLYEAAFRRRFPKVELVDDVLYVDDGDVLTSAGSAAGIDLTLHWLRGQHGPEVADAVARRMVVPPHRDGGQAQFVLPPAPEVAASSFGEQLDWLLEHLHEDLSVQDMARRAAMSPRSFARHFRGATGTTPHRWLTDRRVEHARRLLTTTDLPVDRVATAAGLGSAANLRVRLRERVGLTPSAYRTRFSCA